MRGSPPGDSPSDVAGNDPPLTPAQFHILLALAHGARHGYGIMQEIRERTEGALELGPGTLYRSIKQLLIRGLILEAEQTGPDSLEPGSRRRPYTLTEAGRLRLKDEARRLQALVRWAEDSMVLEGK